MDVCVVDPATANYDVVLLVLMSSLVFGMYRSSCHTFWSVKVAGMSYKTGWTYSAAAKNNALRCVSHLIFHQIFLVVVTLQTNKNLPVELNRYSTGRATRTAVWHW